LVAKLTENARIGWPAASDRHAASRKGCVPLGLSTQKLLRGWSASLAVRRHLFATADLFVTRPLPHPDSAYR
jgi:hypothetical protein